MTPFEFVGLTEKDFEAISSLITGMSVSPGLRLRDKSPAYYRWMYLANPAGKAVVYSARLGGKTAASFAVAPKRFLIDGEEVLIGKTMDMFTDPHFQGRGLIKGCTERVFEAAAAAGMIGWYVTPSVNSYPIFAGRWGYSEHLRVVYRAKILEYGPVLSAAMRPSGLARLVGSVGDRLVGWFRRRFKPPTGDVVTAIDRFDAAADSLWAAVAPGYRVAQVRDARYLNWRYVDNPDEYASFGVERDGELIGIVVLTGTIRRGVPVAEVVDYLCRVDDDELFATLISIGVGWARENGMAMIEAWSVYGTAQDRRIRRSGLRTRRADVKFLMSPGFPLSTVDDPEAWLLTQGDGNDV